VSTSTEQPWHILGAGAIGSLWGAYGCRAGRDIKLIFRNNTQLHDYQNRGGISLSCGDQHALIPVAACSSETLTAPIRQLLICTKAQQTLSALSAIKEFITEGATLVLLQNGLGVAEQIQSTFPKAQLVQASTTEGAYRPEAFSVVHAGRGETLMGSSHANPEQLASLAKSLSFAPLIVKKSDNIDAILWRKLAINCAINPLTVIHHCRNGELLNKPEALLHIRAIVDEILHLSRVLDKEQGLENLYQQILDVAQATAENRSSMHQDVAAGRETEVDAITGHLCQLAAQQGVSLPVNEALLKEIRRISLSRHATTV
jgi:2-dehydropantoate 2-reductase